MSRPTTQQWEDNRERICSLYREDGLRAVVETMREGYQFDATEKMFKSRLAQWGATKYIKADEKKELLKKIKDNPNGHGISEDVMRQLKRFERQQRRKPYRDGKRPRPAEELAGPIEVERSALSRGQPSQSLDKKDSQSGTNLGEPTSHVFDESGQADDDLQSSHQLRTHSFDNHASQLADLPSDKPPPYEEVPSQVVFNGSQQQLSLQGAAHALAEDRNMVAVLSRSLNGAYGTRNGVWNQGSHTTSLLNPESPESRCLEIIKTQIRVYCQYDGRYLQDDPQVTPESQNTREGVAKQFWNDIKNAIYLFKVSSTQLGWEAVRAACHLANAALRVQSFNCIRELLTTLSPVNTSICSDVRRRLLSHFAELTRQMLGDTHHLTVISNQLSLDGGCQLVSQEAMAYMVTQLIEFRGKDCPVTVRAQLALVKLLRRAREYDKAAALSQEILSFCLEHFGNDYILTRNAMRELANVLMDLGHHNEAIRLGYDAVGYSVPEQSSTVVGNGHSEHISSLSSEAISIRHHDDAAVYSMEDMAKSFRKLGDYRRSALWLEIAAEDAFNLWKGSFATRHIIDKLERDLPACGRDPTEIVKAWREKCGISAVAASPQPEDAP